MTDWRDRAKCAGHPRPEMWHSTDADEIAYALAICHKCPVRLECLADRGDDTGSIWGGKAIGIRVQRKATRTCVTCGRFMRITGKGMCGKCYQRQRKAAA